jgi:hypothetical protein
MHVGRTMDRWWHNNGGVVPLISWRRRLWSFNLPVDTTFFLLALLVVRGDCSARVMMQRFLVTMHV